MSKEFRDRYKVNIDNKKEQEIVKKLKKEFKKDRKHAYDRETAKYAAELMSAIGMEFESRYPDIKFELFGRKKSKQSSKAKIKCNIKEALENPQQEGEQNYIEVRPVYDYYGFKVVLEYISEERIKEFAKKYEEINELCKQREKIEKQVEEFKNIDIKEMTYDEFAKMMKKCREASASMAYKESTDEILRILNDRNRITTRLEYDRALRTIKIEERDVKAAEEEREQLLKRIEYKKDDKLQLEIGSKIVQEILEKSKISDAYGIKVSNDPERTKKKRLLNGYISDFYSLSTNDELQCEIQVQSKYRYEFGEVGPAAHNKMANDMKQRKLYKKPKKLTKKTYKKWREKQLKNIPEYYTYKGNGWVHRYHTIDNFKRYNECEEYEKVADYVDYIKENDKKYFNRSYTGYEAIRRDISLEEEFGGLDEPER